MKRTFLLSLALTLIAPADAATADQQALAREVMKLVDAEKMFDALLPQIQQMIAQAMQAMAKQQGLTAEESVRLSKVQGEILAISMESVRGMIPAMERAYAEVYSEGELKAMRAFFSSVEGQSMLKKQPELMKKLGPTMQDAMLATQPKIQLLMQREANRIAGERKKTKG